MAAEPEQANDAYRSMISGSIQYLTNEQTQNPTIADGLRTNLGNIPFQIISRSFREKDSPNIQKYRGYNNRWKC